MDEKAQRASHMTFEEIYAAVFGDDPRVGDNSIRISYSQGEVGWAWDLGDGTAVILNSPLETRLHFLDVVLLYERPGAPRPEAGDVVQGGFARKTFVRYPAGPPEEAEEHYATIWEATRAADLACEGCVPGIACLHHHSSTDLKSMLADAGMDVSVLTFEESHRES